jgi:hypothetical protein
MANPNHISVSYEAGPPSNILPGVPMISVEDFNSSIHTEELDRMSAEARINEAQTQIELLNQQFTIGTEGVL